MLYLHPDAARAYPPGVTASDVFRTAEASLRARTNRKGAQRPGYSGHNFGYSIDLDIAKSMKALRFTKKRELDEYMASYGWHCHRRDHRQGHESWHFNYFGPDLSKYVRANDKRTSSGLERMLQATYGKWWKNMDMLDVQHGLAKLAMYRGNLDGKRGELMTESIRVFQRAWLLDVDGTAGPKTKRTIAYVTAEKRITPNTLLLG